MRCAQPHTTHLVNGVLIEKHEIADGEHLLEAGGKYVTKVIYSRASGLRRWVCGCGDAFRDREDVFAHVVAAHVRVGAADGITPTYLRLVGQHADPTYEQAMRDLPRTIAGI
ncbi:MAG: hypothetical protein H0U76_10045 [Ktedonobacteraceae bacterium]|nr:hypothetical protein [Ktedonobacteraceae bacterium]